MNLLYANDRPGKYPRSYYADTRDPCPDFPTLKGETRADVAVVGGGYTGLSAALHLARRGYDVVLAEAHRVGFGASGRNGGQLGSGQRLDVEDLERISGRETARRLWDLAEEAKTLVRDLAAESGVAVHDGVAHAFRAQSELDQARRHAEHLARHYDYPLLAPMERAEFAGLVPSPVFSGGELDRGAGHLHALNLALGMARLADAAGARIHERTHVHRIDRQNGQTTLRTDTGRIVCRHVILAANGYLGDLEPRIAARVMPLNNFIAATEPLGDRAHAVVTRNIAVHDTKFVVNYWRLSDDGRLLFGGGESLGYRFPRDIAAKVRAPLARIYPALADVAFTHAWGGTLAITMNRLPLFARPRPDTLSASGFSGHGVAIATLAGKLMAEAVAGQAERFDLMETLPVPAFPGGTMLRHPLLVLGMTWFALRDRLGF